jgi:hypothetical protein
MKSAKVRRAVFAGSWYPSSASECEREITGFLAEGRNLHPPGRPLVGGIVPHAGWFFSGAIACRVIQVLAQDAPPDAVVLFGMHMHPGQQPVIMDRGAWETPLGPLPIAEKLADYLTTHMTFRLERPEDPNRDNTIELQLPFIRHLFGEIPILPIGVPPSEAALRVAQTVVEGARHLALDIKIVGSTDLTHYGPNYGFTRHGSGAAAVAWVKEDNDRRFIDAALAMNPEAVMEGGVHRQNACCRATMESLDSPMTLPTSRSTLLVR